jgi:STE24 endopeptidase
VNEDKATRYHRNQRTVVWITLALQIAGMAALLPGGAAIQIRDAVVRVSGAAPASLVTVAGFSVALFVLAEALSLPLTFYRTFVLDHRYGLSTAPLRVWVVDHLKGVIVSLVLALIAAEAVYVALAGWPRWWWAVASAMFSAAIVGLARVTPNVLLPIFYKFKPLDRDALRSRLELLSSRAGLPVLGVYEWGLGAKTSRANAALVGTGRSRRILLSDTLLADYTDDEIEVIIAHELGHHAHRDIRNGLMIDVALIAACFATAAVALNALWRPLGLAAPNDAAGLPLLLFVAGTVSMSTRPALNALSRRNEHRADRFALRMASRPDAFVSAMRRLAAQNLAEARPSTATLWLFHTHPPFEQRIQAARTFLS